MFDAGWSGISAFRSKITVPSSARITTAHCGESAPMSVEICSLIGTVEPIGPVRGASSGRSACPPAQTPVRRTATTAAAIRFRMLQDYHSGDTECLWKFTTETERFAIPFRRPLPSHSSCCSESLRLPLRLCAKLFKA
jgi:hypothetical protein